MAPLGSMTLRALSALLRLNPVQTRSTKLPATRYLNVGCGRRSKPNFVNLDYIWQPGVDLVYDLSKKLPFERNQLSGIFSEHCLEHLPFDLVTGHVLKEFYRILAPGGRLRIVVPDAGAYIQKYYDCVHGHNVEFPVPDPEMKTPMMYVNQCFRHHGHLYAYDAQTLIYLLNTAGFSNAVQEKFGSGGDPNLLIDAPERASESLYVEAIKPL